MKNAKMKILATLFWIITSLIGLFILTMMFNFISDRLLWAGYLEFDGVSQFFRVLFGWGLFFLLIFCWISLFIWSAQYYMTGVDKNLLIARFLIITAGELFCFPLITLLYQLSYSIKMEKADWIVTCAGFSSGSLMFLLLTILPENRQIINSDKRRKQFKYIFAWSTSVFFLLILFLIIIIE